jgi:hypothetical protein
MSAAPVERPASIDTLAGFLAATAIFVAAIAVVQRPLPLSIAALVLSLVAAGLGGRHHRLIDFSVAAATLSFVLGMSVAVLTGRPLF